MGLDQYAGLRDSNGNVHDETFIWRKHARLQVFMNKQFKKQLSEKKHNTVDDLQHLGFNAGEGGVRITEEVIKELEKQLNQIITMILLTMVFSGVNNFRKKP